MASKQKSLPGFADGYAGQAFVKGMPVGPKYKPGSDKKLNAMLQAFSLATDPIEEITYWLAKASGTPDAVAIPTSMAVGIAGSPAPSASNIKRAAQKTDDLLTMLGEKAGTRLEDTKHYKDVVAAQAKDNAELLKNPTVRADMIRRTADTNTRVKHSNDLIEAFDLDRRALDNYLYQEVGDPLRLRDPSDYVPGIEPPNAATLDKLRTGKTRVLEFAKPGSIMDKALKRGADVYGGVTPRAVPNAPAGKWPLGQYMPSEAGVFIQDPSHVSWAKGRLDIRESDPIGSGVHELAHHIYFNLPERIQKRWHETVGNAGAHPRFQDKELTKIYKEQYKKRGGKSFDPISTESFSMVLQDILVPGRPQEAPTELYKFMEALAGQWPTGVKRQAVGQLPTPPPPKPVPNIFDRILNIGKGTK